MGIGSEQSLHHFITESPWQIKDLRLQRLRIILQILRGREISLIIDETGDKKKGNKTDYVKRQYIGNLGKIENGIVAVTAYGLLDGMTFPLDFEVYKPSERLLSGDTYKSKPIIAADMIRELTAMGFKFSLVLADSLYGESAGNFISVLNELKLNFAVAIRSNHGVWLPPGQTVRYNKWHASRLNGGNPRTALARKFYRVFSDGKTEVRYIRQIIFGKRNAIQYWQITTDTDTLPENSTWWVMTLVPGIKYNQVGNLYGLRNWVEYGLKQSKNELGWADFRVTDYAQIEKWWEIVMSAYLLVSLHAQVLNTSKNFNNDEVIDSAVDKFSTHDWWDSGQGWKNILNNLRLVIQPWVFFNLIKRSCSKVFPISHLSLGFPRLIALMNKFRGAITTPVSDEDFQFSSA